MMSVHSKIHVVTLPKKRCFEQSPVLPRHRTHESEDLELRIPRQCIDLAFREESVELHSMPEGLRSSNTGGGYSMVASTPHDEAELPTTN